MAMDMQEYFRLRCVDTLEALQNMQVLFDDLRKHVHDPLLKGIIQQQDDTIGFGIANMEQIVSQKKKTTTKRKTTEAEAETPERLVVVGRTWVGTVGRGTIEHYRVYVTQIPSHLIDVNAAMLSEEIAHFNLGNYTGLIVLAKELGHHDHAQLLQQNIDREAQIRNSIENSLWQIVHSLHEQETRKAA